MNLEDEDVVFIKKFLKASGSLKEMAQQYGVTYPREGQFWNVEKVEKGTQ